MEELKRLLYEHKERHPQLTPEDLIKLIYQNEFGSGHFISDEEASLARLEEEMNGIEYVAGGPFEAIGNGLVRLHLRALGDALPPQTVNRFFVLTAAQRRGSIEGFEAKLTLLKELYPGEGLNLLLEQYKEAGYPPKSHSPRYREFYAPSYRVVSDRFALYFPVFQAIEGLLAENTRIVVAIDGRSGSGKSSLAQLLRDVYSCPVISMDHFFLRPEQRRADRLSEPGGNVDYERFQREVIAKLRDEAFHYQIYNCQLNSFGASPTIEPHRLTVIEGSYSHHPLLAESYDLRVFLTVQPKVQKERLLKRSGPVLLERFLNEWIPLEEQYASALDIPEKSDLVVDTGAYTI